QSFKVRPLRAIPHNLQLCRRKIRQYELKRAYQVGYSLPLYEPAHEQDSAALGRGCLSVRALKPGIDAWVEKRCPPLEVGGQERGGESGVSHDAVCQELRAEEESLSERALARFK